MILIVGAGPAGSQAAYMLAKAGKKCLLIEEHKKPGCPIQCTGILTKSVLRVAELSESDIKPITAFVAKSTFVYSPDGNHAEIKLKGDYIVYRDQFDQMLAERAVRAGTKLLLYHKFIGFKDGKAIIEDKENKKQMLIDAEYVIGADGPKSAVAQAAGIYGNRMFVNAPQCLIKHKHRDAIEFYPHVGVIAWICPEGKDKVRAGICTYGNPTNEFNDFLKKELGDYKNNVIEHQGGIIPIYNPRLKTELKIETKPGNVKVMLIGDSAMQVKPTTFGGIVQGMTAANCAAEAVLSGKSYEKLWKAKLHKDLMLGLLIRRTLDKFTDEDYNRLIRICCSEKVKKIFSEYDRDYPTAFVFKLMTTEPKLLWLARKFFYPVSHS